MRPVRTVIAIMFAAAIAVTGCTAHSAVAPTPSSAPAPSVPTTTPSVSATPTTSLPLGRIQRLDAVQAVGDTGVVWAVGKGTILTTSNGGRTWLRVWRGTQELREVDFVNASTGWALGDDLLLGTIDGGQHWRQLGQPRRGPLRRVHFSSATQGWGVAGGTGPARPGATGHDHPGPHQQRRPELTVAPTGAACSASLAPWARGWACRPGQATPPARSR